MLYPPNNPYLLDSIAAENAPAENILRTPNYFGGLTEEIAVGVSSADPLDAFADKTAVLHPANNLPLDWLRWRSAQEESNPYSVNGNPYSVNSTGYSVNSNQYSATHYQPPTPIHHSPFTIHHSQFPSLRAPTALYTTTLQPLHRATGYPGFSSSFAFTNTGVTTVTYDINFYWLNGQYVGSDNGYLLSPGQRLDYYMDSAAIGETTFVGIVEITGDEPLDAQITSPDYGIIQGTIYEDDGITPAWVHNVRSNSAPPNWQDYGNTYNLGDGRFYLGGLPDDNYNLWIQAPYPWASQWYNQRPNWEDADLLAISGAGTISVAVVLQPGGRITGTVYANDGVTPLPNINVDLEPGGYGACTDANGRYLIEGIPYGDHIIRAGGDWNFCLGQDSIYPTTYYSNTHDYNQATPIAISGTADTVVGINFHLQQGGIITGQVLDNNTGLPIPNTHVNANEYDNGWFGRGAWTDASGIYTITGLLPADYRVGVDDGNNLPLGYARQYYDHQPYHHLADPVPVPPGGLVANINFDLLPGGAFSGTVYADDGITPLPNINVDTEPGGHGTCTDENGRFYINGVPFGDYQITAGGGWNWCLNQPSQYIREYYLETPDPNAAAIFTLDAAHLLYPNLDFTLSVGGRITGRVTNENGDPLVDVTVNANNYDPDWPTGYAHTDTSGYYTITGLIEGDHRVAVYNPPDGYAFQFYPDTVRQDDAARVAVTTGNITPNIDFVLHPGGIITGQVVDQNSGLPIANTKVDVHADNWGWGTCTDDNGYYVHRAMPYGDYRVSSGGDWDWCQQQQNEYGQEYYNEKHNWDEADILTLDGGSTPITGINFTLEKGGFLAGHVSDDIAQPVENLRMVAVQGSGNCPWCEDHIADTYTDAAGNYVIGPIPPGDYTVLADTDANGQLLVREYYNDVYELSAATFVSVTSEITTTGLNFILDPGVWLTGHIDVPSGYSNEGIWVNAWKTDGIWYGTGRHTNASGNYILPLPPIYDSYWGVSAHPDGPDLMYKWAHQFDLAQHTNWDFDLGYGATISGCITDDGTPVVNAWVNADAGEMNNGAQTDENGCYAITNLPPSPTGYQIRVDDWESGRMWMSYGGHDWGWQTRIPLVEGDAVGGIDFEVPWRGQIEGYVYESDGTTPIEGLRVVAMNDNGFWEGYSQPDGYFTIDAPVGELRLMFAGDYIPVAYYPDSSVHQYADATPIMVSPLPTTTMVTMAIERAATVHGQVTDSGSGDPLGGILVAVRNIDTAVNRDVASSGCTDENGNYYLEGVWAGDSLVEAIGTCGNWDYRLVTTTVTIAANSDHEVNLTMTAVPMPPTPFTIHTNDTFNYNALSSGGNTYWDAQYNAEQILAALFEPLVGLNDSGDWTSELLTQIPTLGNGGAAIVNERLVVTYTLKPGMLWSDGAPLTSADIRFTWEMLSTPTPWSDTWLAEVGNVTKIESVETPDALTAVATYKIRAFPTSYLLAITYLLPEHQLGGQYPLDVKWLSEYAHNPVGNGPYMVADWIPGSHLDLIANPNYHKRALGLPRMTQVRFLFTSHPFYSMVYGPTDVSLNVAWDMPEDYDTYGLAIYESEENAYWSIVPNTERPYFQDPVVRQAIYTAFNRAQAAPRIFNGLVADSWLPPSHFMYSDTVNLYNYDPTAAAAMLSAAGWIDHNGNGIRDKDGVELQFDLYAGYNSYQPYLEVASVFQTNMAAVGIDVNIIDTPDNDNNRYWNAIQHGEADAFITGWGFDERYDPFAFKMGHSSQIPTGYNSYWYWGYFNGRWQNAAYDTLLLAAHSELDTATLQGLYAGQLDMQTDQLPLWPFAHRLHVDTAVPTLLNFRPAAYLPATWNIEEWRVPANPYDLTVRKTLAADSPAPQPGNDIIYAITVRNVGYFPVTGATLVDTLPTAVTFVSADPAPTTISGQTLIWDLGTVPGSSTPQVIRVTVHIPAATPHGTPLLNTVEVFGDQPDTFPSNNGYSYQLTVREDVDLAVTKFGVGEPAIGETFNYYVDYANWGGAPASGAVVTDTLPPEVSFISANPAPDTVNGSTLTWNLPNLVGNQWGGQIEITAEIVGAGTVTNSADIMFGGVDVDLGNNSADSVEEVNAILSPIITQPTQGVADGTPTIAGLAPSEAVVELWDLTSAMNAFAPNTPTLLVTTTADISGTFSVELALDEGTYIVTAVAHKAGLSSGYSNTATFEVNHSLPLDTDSVAITADGATISRGVVRANKYTIPHRLLNVGVGLTCSGTLETHLEVTENALFTYDVPAVSLINSGGDQWQAEYRLWLAEPHSTYDVWVEWDCDGVITRELLVYILIDPDGYLYDQSLVDGGSPITDSLVLDGVITAYVLVGDEWQVWPAEYYGQTNPQVTDETTDDGVLEAGYYSFLTPPGKYRIAAVAPGYQPYQSPVLTVVDTPIHLDIGLEPLAGGDGQTMSPANLSASGKAVDLAAAWVGDVLTYDIWLANSGGEDTAVLNLTDLIPDNTAYVDGSLGWDGGNAGFDAGSNTIWWDGIVSGGETVHINYQVQVVNSPGTPFDVVNESVVTGTLANLATLDGLTAVTTIQNVVGVDLNDDAATQDDPGASVVYELHISNTGNSTDTFTIAADSSAGWLATAFEPVTVSAGTMTVLPVYFDIPADAPAAAADVTTLTAASSLSSAVSNTIVFTTTANQVAALTLADAAPQAAAPGTAVTYTHLLQNLGNGVDTFVLTAVSDQEWLITTPANPTLNPGETITITLVVQVPAGAAPDTMDTTTLTVYSSFNNGVVASTMDETTVKLANHFIYLPVITRQ
ncbi:MAG: carboxypeptidase regulatory-like domain-containing protein [Ardenticatenaceae bacterium]|nr:carboxypeptidase regulatory-like domain-containing protein [Ardenticatenaceae bacterium]